MMKGVGTPAGGALIGAPGSRVGELVSVGVDPLGGIVGPLGVVRLLGAGVDPLGGIVGPPGVCDFVGSMVGEPRGFSVGSGQHHT